MKNNFEVIEKMGCNILFEYDNLGSYIKDIKSLIADDIINIFSINNIIVNADFVDTYYINVVNNIFNDILFKNIETDEEYIYNIYSELDLLYNAAFLLSIDNKYDLEVFGE